MKQKLIIIGAGDVGGFIAKHLKDFGQFDLVGILDDDRKKHDKEYFGCRVLGDVEYLRNYGEPISVVLAIANPKAKAAILKKINQYSHLIFPNFIHPRAWLGANVRLGKGVIIYPGVSINYESVLRDHTIVNMNTAIGHNCDLGVGSTLSPGVNLGGFTTIGRFSFMGIGASTIQGTNIGEKVVVGGMGMVIRDIPDNLVVVGNPTTILKKEQNVNR